LVCNRGTRVSKRGEGGRLQVEADAKIKGQVSRFRFTNVIRCLTNLIQVPNDKG